MSTYKDFELLWPKLSEYILVPEYAFAKQFVGEGKNLRDRLKKEGLQNWRLDYAIPDIKVYLEIQGMSWGHKGNSGMLRDMRKFNSLAKMGWRGLLFPPDTVKKSPNFVCDELLELIRVATL